MPDTPETSPLLETQGATVNNASDSARTGEHSMSVYGGAKASVIGVTKSLAKEIGRNGVRANVVFLRHRHHPRQLRVLAGQNI